MTASIHRVLTGASMLAMLVTGGALGCASFAPPLTCPAKGGAPWAELTSRHLVIQTDIDIADARDDAVAFEHSYDALSELVFRGALRAPGKVDVVLFERERDYRQFGSAVLDGYYAPALPHDIEPTPTMVLFGELSDRTRFSFQHQLTHHFVHLLLGDVPPWLDEGLAVYYSTLRVEGGLAYMGAALNRRYRGLLVDRAGRQNARWDEPEIPISHVPTAPELFAADRTVFYAHAEDNWDTPDEERERQAVYYIGAWTLVHMLISGAPEYRARFKALSAALAARTPFPQAWQGSFGDLPIDKLNDDYRHYLAYGPLEVQAMKYSDHPVPLPERERAMTDAEVHILWARLDPWDGAWAARAGKQIEEASAAGPGAPEVRFWRGLFDLSQGRLAESEQALCAAHAARPDERRYTLALSRLFSEEDRKSATPPAAPHACPR